MKVVLFRNLLFSLAISISTGFFAGDRTEGIAAFRSAARLCFYLSGNRFIGWSRFCASLPRGEDLAERNHLDFDDDNGLRVAHDGVPAPAPSLMGCAFLAGIAWSLAGSELWVAGNSALYRDGCVAG